MNCFKDNSYSIGNTGITRAEALIAQSPRHYFMPQQFNNPAFEGKTLVVILPDSGERYLSSIMFEDIQA